VLHRRLNNSDVKRFQFSAELRSDGKVGPGRNKGPAFAPVEDLSDVDDLIALLKQEGP